MEASAVRRARRVTCIMASGTCREMGDMATSKSESQADSARSRRERGSEGYVFVGWILWLMSWMQLNRGLMARAPAHHAPVSSDRGRTAFLGKRKP